MQRREKTAPGESNQAPLSSSGLVVQRNVTSDPIAHTEKNGRAGTVSAENIQGIPLGLTANSPSVNPHGWPELNSAGHTLSNTTGNNSHYNAVRMHLMNGRLGGPGNQTWNLAPGPATINSSMSAGPETAAKDAVTNGHSVWLQTEVSYQNVAPLNANDFRTVVPNQMKMEWGYMASTGRGVARPPAWDVPIPQPAGTLTVTQQTQYQSVTTWSALNTLLANAGDQEQAQAYSLVPSALRKDLILNYPKVYQGLADPDRTTALRTFSAAEAANFATSLFTIPGDVVDEVLAKLYAHTTHLQAVFQVFSSAYQSELAVAGGRELLTQLGDVGTSLAGTSWDVFTVLCPPYQPVLRTLDPAQIRTLFGSHLPNGILSDWCDELGLTTVNTRKAHADAKLDTGMAESFASNALRVYRSADEEKAQIDAGARRSSRSNKGKRPDDDMMS